MIISIASVTFKIFPKKVSNRQSGVNYRFQSLSIPTSHRFEKKKKKNDTFTLPLDSDLNLNFSQILFTRVNKLNPPLTSRKGYIYASLYPTPADKLKHKT